MNDFICPVCRQKLKQNNKSLTCGNNHNFDIAKSGYVNLLMSQQKKEKHHGDDKLMVNSRRDFLDEGYYNVLLNKILTITKKYCENNFKILDAGCGECFYTSNILKYLTQNQIIADMMGIDISKDALFTGAKRDKRIKLAVASIFKLPIDDNYCDMLINIFAPLAQDEFLRVIKPGSIMIRVIPMERHLWSLKGRVYDNPYENQLETESLNGFILLEKIQIRDRIFLKNNQDILNAFKMTPYYYKTSSQDQAKLIGIDNLETEIEFSILVYRKKLQ